LSDLIVIGGGLAGTEAAWQAAEQGLDVLLYEMRPVVQTGAHVGGYLAELVCSNSLGSNIPDRASGLLKNEMRRLNSLLMACAEETAVPAGGALAVDREGFGQAVTAAIEAHPRIQLIREEVREIPNTATIIASGPLTAEKLSEDIAQITGEEHLYFYDAISPIVDFESVDMDVAYRASRYDRGEDELGDYINCPLDQPAYEAFIEALVGAERIELKDFEQDLGSGVRAGLHKFFEGCLPLEVMASRGKDSLAYGPLRPVGLRDPKTGYWPHAVVQLRQDNLAGSLFNLVGFQTNLTFPEQRRVFRMIPGLEQARFERYGQMHRNTFIHAPTLLNSKLQFTSRPDLFFAGQITGVEGYGGNIATGLLAGLNAARLQQGKPLLELPVNTMLGALLHYVTHAAPADFQPMKANYGIMQPLTDGIKRNRRERAAAYAERSLLELDDYLAEMEPVQS
jgi:methylenetetrahydrofolate--tRNA-(uracil-5-)-methyltransferase